MPEFIRTGGDAFGEAIKDCHRSGNDAVMDLQRVEDGFAEDMSAIDYFETFENWSELDRALVQWVKGRVLDIGAGAGRVSLYLQDNAHDVVAMDMSDGCIEVLKERGIRDVRKHNILSGPLENEKFDTICLFGANLGISGFADYRVKFLEILKSMLNPDGRIIGTQVNWEETDRPEHIDFQRQLRDQGRHPVEMTLKIEYLGISEEFSWVLTSMDELREIAPRAGLETEVLVELSSNMYGYVLKIPGESMSDR